MRLLRAYALIVAAMLITGCATKVQYRYLAPPDELLLDCERRAVRLEVNSDLAVAYATRDQDLNNCNADKASLRVWRDEMTSGVERP